MSKRQKRAKRPYGGALVEDVSVVERYRAGEANGELRMRLSDMEGERAIFCALQIYLNEVERAAIWRWEDVSIYEMEPWQQSVVAKPTPYELEVKLRALWGLVQDPGVDTGFPSIGDPAREPAGTHNGNRSAGHEALPTPGSYALAEEVCEALFATRRRGFGNAGGASYPYVIPRDLWSHDEGRRARRRDAVATPVNPIPDLVPVARWLKSAFGELVSQAEASRRLGLTEVGVRARVQEGRLRSVRVGGSVMIPVADLPSYSG